MLRPLNIGYVMYATFMPTVNKKNLFHITGQERQECKAEMLKACMPLAKYCEEVSADADEEPSTKRQRSMFEDIMEAEVTPTVTIRGQVEEEIDSYLKAQRRPQDDCPLEYWRNETRFPTVKGLAEIYLPVLASSAPVERLFSQAGRIFRTDRCSLSDDNFQKLMNIRSNRQFYIKK